LSLNFRSTPAAMSLIEPTAEQKAKYVASVPYAELWSENIIPGMVASSQSILNLADAPLGPDDIVIASYPKSGTTWISEVVSAIAFGGDTVTIKGIAMEDRVPWLEIDIAKVVAAMPDSPVLAPKPPIPGLALAKKRVFFTHIHSEYLPKAIKEGKAKLVYVARNPKDAAVSFYHFHRMAKHLGNQIDMPWNDYFPLFASGHIACGSWFKHALGYWNFAKEHPANAKFVVYEDMKKDLMAVMEDLESFVGVPLSKEQRVAVVQHCSFGSMRDNKMTNREGWEHLFDDKGPKFMRKGIVGDWKNYFTVAQNEEFDELYKKKMTGSGLDFEFE
ncbi:hypothetical protein PENTCL1PPCAC_9092, partial [Pristionchus entomophagus]